MVEYSSFNTHKEIHVGHMRNLSLGHTVFLILKQLGHEVVSSTFPGDMGTHVAKCLWYYKKHNTDKKVFTCKKTDYLQKKQITDKKRYFNLQKTDYLRLFTKKQIIYKIKTEK